jgi:oligopeptide transport system permease protein
MMEHLSPNQRAWRRFKQNRPAVVSMVFLAVLCLLVLVWPLFSKPALAGVLPKGVTHSPVELSDQPFATPNGTYWMGTDVNGRDLLSRIMHGARISILVGIVGALVSLVIGVLWGAIAGFLGGWWDGSMMRFVDILYALPSIVFVIVLITTLEELVKGWFTTTFGAGIAQYTRMSFLFVGIGAVSWLTMARIVRGQVLSLKNRQFVDASRSLGAGPSRILFRHILPNVIGIIIVYITLTVPSVILYESFLSYLGLGIQPPFASWGSLISEGAAQLNPVRINWWLIVFPAVTLVSTLLSLNFFGDGLRDAFDPRG